MDLSKLLPWEDGYYKLTGFNNVIFRVDGEDVKIESLCGQIDVGSWKLGNFGDAHPELARLTGKDKNNINIELYSGRWLARGVFSNENKSITFWGICDKVYSFKKMSEENYVAFKDSADLENAPSSHYKPIPEIANGNFIWISGAPGLGKSTSGLLLSKLFGYVYYEGDAFVDHTNPYIPPEVEEPSIAISGQKPLKEVPPDRLQAIEDGFPEFIKFFKGEPYNQDRLKGYYTAMCKNIKSEKSRLGGDWAVACGVPTKQLRDHIRTQLGPDLVFVILVMPEEDQKKRILARHGEESGSINERQSRMYELFEPAQKDESKTIDITIDIDMTRKDVVHRIMEKTCNLRS